MAPVRRITLRSAEGVWVTDDLSDIERLSAQTIAELEGQA